MTNELPYVYQALERAGVSIHTTTNLIGFDAGVARLENLFHRAPLDINVDGVVIVGHRDPNDALYNTVLGSDDGNSLPPMSLIGDAMAPGAIVHAVHSGHSFARGLVDDNAAYLRDEPVTLPEPAPAFDHIRDAKS
jgi:dimethylamine/trimethylamine dehydrogenase